MISVLTLSLSIFLALIFFWLLKKYQAHQLNIWLFFLFGLLPAIVIYLWDTNFRVYGWHGFMHASIVYQFLNGNFPPNNPIFANEPLLYPWGPNLVVAGIVSIFNITPATAFAVVNVILLALTIILVFKITLSLYRDRIIGIFAVFLAIFGITFWYRGPIAYVLQTILDKLGIGANVGMWIIDLRPMPVFNKFMAPGANNQAGILLFTVFLYSILSVASDRAKAKVYYFLIFISVLSTVFLYPLYLPALVACALVSCLMIYFKQKRLALTKIIGILAGTFLGALLMLPYLYQISAGKSEAAAITLEIFNLPHLLITISRFLLTMLPLAIIIYWKREIFLKTWRDREVESLILTSIILVTSLMYITIHMPLSNQYKYLIIACISLAILMSSCIKDLYFSHRLICFAILASFLIPLSSFILSDMRFVTITDPYIEEGKYLIHQDKTEQALYNYISTQTEPNAVFIDNQLTIPVFARRQLYVGLDTQPNNNNFTINNGWAITMKILLNDVNGYAPNLIAKRTEIAQEIFSEKDNNLSQKVFLELANFNKHGFYIVARNANIHNKLDRYPNFTKVFQSDRTAVYKLL